jgi:FKBP-type peptidyl-prolyl cis-trans isomerase FklB
MRHILLLPVIILLSACQDKSIDSELDLSHLPDDVEASVYPGVLDTRTKRLSYSMATNLAHRLEREAIPVDPEYFALGLEHALGKQDALMTDKQVAQYLLAEEKDRKVKEEEFDALIAEKNLVASKQFFEVNAKVPRVITLPSGLQYLPRKEGVGEPPRDIDTVEVKYTAKFIDGTLFDDSSRHGGAVSFPVGGVIPGWSEALTRMAPGSRWQVFIPPELGYGVRGYREAVPPNTVLIFDVELISVSRKPDVPMAKVSEDLAEA